MDYTTSLNENQVSRPTRCLDFD